VLALGFLLGWAITAGGCVSVPRTVNVSEQAGLAEATRLEIAESVTEPQAGYEQRLIVTDPTVLSRLDAALDADLPLGPPVDCLAQYRLRFVLTTGEAQVLDYFCQGGESFLTGGQTFWSGQQVVPPAEFDAIMGDLLRTLPSASGRDGARDCSG
jgi:hypothetical protein